MMEENDKYYDQLLDDIDIATLMEDVDSESGSQNGLQGEDVEDPAHDKEAIVLPNYRKSICLRINLF